MSLLTTKNILRYPASQPDLYLAQLIFYACLSTSKSLSPIAHRPGCKLPDSKHGSDHGFVDTLTHVHTRAEK